MSNDFLRDIWNKQEVENHFSQAEIFKMLSRKSLNNVKIILGVNALELILGLVLGIYSYCNGIKNVYNNFDKELGNKIVYNQSIETLFNWSHWLLIFNVLFFILLYFGYKRLYVESSIKQFTQKLIHFRKIGYAYLLYNVAVVVVFMIVFYFVMVNSGLPPNLQGKTTIEEFKIGFIISLIIAIIVMLLLLGVYYYIIYGIVLRKINKNIQTLKEIEKM